jgi:SAM-dependent methyltransferase
MAVQLDQIVPWGRSRREYDLMFGLTPALLSQGVLDCGGGPASFTAEVTAAGYRAVSADPIYAYSGAQIRARFEAAADSMLAQIHATPDDWIWSFHRNPEDLLANRFAALDAFLVDYDKGLQQRRYIVAELPSLPFESGSFGLAVCSHLLFLYSDLLSADFHVRAVRELCRVANEVRIFPLLTLRAKPSPHIDAVRSALGADGWASDVVRVDYELQRGGNEMLRIFRSNPGGFYP